MKFDRSHPADDRLIALYFGDEAVGSDERRHVRQHLHGCEACTWRYTELTAPLERLRQDAASEADEVFTPMRLEAQRSAVLDRLDGVAAEHKVIAFPAATIRMNSSAIRRPLSRWIAAAAAAGLLVGLMGSRILPVGAGRIQPQVPVARSVMPAVPTPAALVSDSLAPAEFEGDELALSEIDQAVHTQRIAALSTLDEMTPTIRPAEMIARSRAIR